MKWKKAAVADRSGITLLETLVYFSLLVVILSLTYSALYRTLDTSKHLGRNAQDISRVLRAGERWREDVRSALGPIQMNSTTSVTTITLHRKDAVIRYTFREGACWREISGRDEPEKFLDRVRASQFISEVRSTWVCWRWEIELEPLRTKANMKPLFSFIAPAGTHPSNP